MVYSTRIEEEGGVILCEVISISCRTFAGHSSARLCTVVINATGITTNKLDITNTYI